MALSLTVVSGGENALIFYLPAPPRDDYPIILQALAQKALSLGAIEAVPAYHSLLVMFKSRDGKTLEEALCSALPSIEKSLTEPDKRKPLTIPICYDSRFAPDLEALAKHHGLSTEAVIAKHTARTYRVCCLGFIPGFAFLGYVDQAIATPRRANPRPAVAAGSVGIAGKQTGCYPVESPGGWNIIGRTPMSLYAPEKGIFSRFHLADRVRFQPISYDEFMTWEALP